MQSSKILRGLFSPVTALAAKSGSPKDSLTPGSVSGADIDAVQSSPQ